jgi:hypothetical protein
MDPAALIPTPDTLPVHSAWFQVLLFCTFYLHIVLMNVMFGTAFIATVNHLRRVTAPNVCTETISHSLPFVIAFTVNFGVPPLLFAQVLYGHFLYTSSILMAVFWLSIAFLLVVAYSLAYVYKGWYAQAGRLRLPLTLTITVLLACIAFFFVNNLSLMQNPESWGRYFDHPQGLLLNLGDPSFIPRFLHFMIGAVAIGGLAIAVYFHWRRPQGEQTADNWIVSGCRWFSGATLFNMGVGLWFFLSLPGDILSTAHPQGWFLLLALAGGVVLSVPAVIYGLAARVVPTLLCAMGALALMLLARSFLRTALLAPWFSVSQLTVIPAVSPLLFFLAFFTGGMVLIIWLIRLALRPKADEATQP